MTSEPEKESMDIDSAEEGQESPDRLERNGLYLYPVSANVSGVGLPYAPDDWPNPGDKWTWKVGRRVSASGYFLDRYMYPPKRYHDTKQKKAFASRLSLEQFIQANFPSTDVDAFFASFSWKVPSKLHKKERGEILRLPVSNGVITKVHCKAGNRLCNSSTAGEEPDSELMPCDICCSEPDFCRDCCCILCCRTVDHASEGCSYIKCVANIEGSCCGHICHIECALRSYMIGTIEGTIGLDAEYYCRRCDSRSDLVSYVGKLLQKFDSNVSRDELDKTLSVGCRLLRGSKRPSAKQLLNQIQVAMTKLKNGTCLDDIWKMENVSATCAGVSPKTNGGVILRESEELQGLNFDHRVESLKLDNEIDETLDSLRKSQQIEYKLAEEKLTSQKNYVINLYEKLDRERSTLSRYASSVDHDSLLDSVVSRIEQVKREVSRLKDMREVAKGFGKVPKCILEEHFGLDVEH